MANTYETIHRPQRTGLGFPVPRRTGPDGRRGQPPRDLLVLELAAGSAEHALRGRRARWWSIRGSATLQRLSKSTFTTLGDPGPVAPCISREPDRALPEGRNHRHGQLQMRQAGRWLRLELDLRRPGSPRQRGSNGSLHPDRALGLLEPTSRDAAGQREGSPALRRAGAIHVLAPERSRETSSTNRPLRQRES